MGKWKKRLSDSQLAELEEIRQASGGVLHADSVIERARDKVSSLHGEFNWDVKEAAYEHWRWQARRLITCAVTIIPHTQVETRCYVSLSKDRKNQGGYRTMVDVLSDDEMRSEMLADALREYERVGEKFSLLSEELAPVWAALGKVKRKKAAQDRAKKKRSLRTSASS
jgi:hypothetical protein